MAKMYDKVTINSIDVTEYRITWNYESEWRVAIDSLIIDLSPAISSALTLEVGQRIIVTRGFVTSTDETVFDGDITQVKPQVDRMSLVAKGRMYDAVKSAQVKSYDKNIDTEAGIGSEIFKSLCDDAGLSYTPAAGDLTNGSINFTGSGDPDKIVKFIQNDEDDFQKMDELAELYDYIIYYDYSTGLVYFQPKGFVVYSRNLTVGIDIQNQIKWKVNMEQMINKVKIHGSTVYDKINPAVFTGPATTFQLLKTPEDTEVRDTNSSGTLYTRGQKGVGILGTTFDYYVDTVQKTIVFATNKSNVWVRYGAQVPMPVVLSDPASIIKYGGPNQIAHFKTFTFNDLKDVVDAEDKGRAILNKYSTPFYETREDVQIDDTVIQNYGLIKPGYLVRIIDNFNNLDLNVFVKIVKKSIPHIGDRIIVGDEIWRTEDWQSTQMKKINLLFNELNKNQDVLITTIDLSYDIPIENRYSYIEKRSLIGNNSFIIGSAVSGILGTNKLGWGGTAFSTIALVQGDQTYTEYFYDTIFKGTGTANWDTTNKRLAMNALSTHFPAFTHHETNYIALNNEDISTVKLIVDETKWNPNDQITYYITGDNGITWELMTKDIVTTLSTGFSDLRLKVVFFGNGNKDTYIENLQVVLNA